MADDPKQAKRRHVELSDLPDDMLMEILSRVPVDKLIAIETASRTWKRCVSAVLSEIKVIVIGYASASSENIESTCGHLQLARDNRQTLFVNLLSKKWGYNNRDVDSLNPRLNRHRRIKCFDFNVDSLIQRLIRHPRIKCLDLSRIQGVTKEFLEKLTNAFPELECLSLGSILLLCVQQNDAVEWRRIFGELSSKLVHLKICSKFFIKNKCFDMSFLINGDRLREVHLSSSCDDFVTGRGHNLKLKSDLLDQMRSRPQIELSLDLDWLSLEYDFSCFSHLTFGCKEVTSASKTNEDPAAGKSEIFTIDESLSEKCIFERNSLVAFKTFERLKIDNIKIDKNSFKCRFGQIETLQLINTCSKDDADFAKLFGSMQQLKYLFIRIDEWLPNYRCSPGQSLTVLKRLEKLEIDLAIEHQEQIRMTELFNALMQMSSLKCVEMICTFNRYLNVPEVIKQTLIVAIALLCLSSTKINVELRFNKHEFKVDVNEEVMEWYAMSCRFEQISQKYTEEDNVYIIKITSKNY